MVRTLPAASRASRKLLALTLAALSISVAGSALAQTRSASSASVATEAGAGKRDAANTVSYKQKTTYDFENDEVEGSTVRPDGNVVDGRGKSKHESLLKPRTNFQLEMLKSVESL